jgi:formiminotetrahydrofolate cyclodeaminase
MSDEPQLVHLDDLTIREFLGVLAAGRPTPGGGSAAALAGAAAAALVCMVARITLAKPRPAVAEARLQAILALAGDLQVRLTALVESDALAYERVLAAYRLPRDNAQAQDERDAAIQAAFSHAADVPLETARASAEVLHLAAEAAELGLPTAASDAAVAALLAHAALQGAALNVAVNLEILRDAEFVAQADRTLDELLSPGQAAVRRALTAVQPGA